MNLETAKRLSQKYALLGRMISPVQHFRASALQKSRAGKREVVRNLRNVLVTDPEVVIKEFEGKFSIDYRSDLFERIVIDGHYEPDLVRFCKKYLVGRRDVLDIGANIGFYTVMFAKNLHGRRVVAVEPTQNALKRLRTNITLNHVEDRVVV